MSVFLAALGRDQVFNFFHSPFILGRARVKFLKINVGIFSYLTLATRLNLLDNFQFFLWTAHPGDSPLLNRMKNATQSFLGRF